ncbi:MAG: hypothetical protein PHV16_01320 [Candidatus Nanoarchaeia archaeon]|nr:hypothetical protein [Candidatus Nanoarchaeia archaeon]
MRKGQAAMEFLMTYGWAILVVLLAIAALAYFGVLNPGRYLPASCTIEAGLSCVEFKVDSNDQVTLVLQNGKGENLNSINVSIGGENCNGFIEQDTEGESILVDGSKATFVITCDEDLVEGSRFQGDIEVGYLSENDISRSIKGTLTTRVE